MIQLFRAIEYQACFEDFYELTGMNKTQFMDNVFEKIRLRLMPHPENVFAWRMVELLGTEI